ncbi:MFS transporter [Novosphingobium sp. KCTC 2891]|uniref:spinster family MFS transporter n=1 Tax=Novosphingobium sp. KCTC 2891 TaxID=2989730 RepID=UPI00222278D3|nr:MFS transporter [Novosphingobium sp. KCTC 2891]MCW1383605.1 MFS transporter [Novosphingobium sp. KCTC 2891]
MHDTTSRSSCSSPAVKPTRPWLALGLLLLAYTISFVDRTAVSVVQEKLKFELGLTDWHLGLMIGPAFAIVYSLAGLPMARLAERRNRARLLAGCLAVWSLMVMACGMGRNFVELFLARMGVGIGEAGGNPASHSLIADLFPANRRARAIAIYTLGAPIGSFLGAALVGWMAQALGWRHTFLLLGVPGVVCALLVWRLMPSPPRGGLDIGLADEKAGQDTGNSVPPLGAVLRDLLGRPAFRHLVWGGSLVVLVGYGVPAFLPAYLTRQFHLPLAEVGLIAGLVNGVAAGIGTILGGIAGDRWGASDARRLALIPAFMVLPAAPLLVGGLLSGSLWVAVAGTFLGNMAICGYIAPAFAQVHRMATTRSRATVTAVYYLITNLVGLGLGPPIIGAISDTRARQMMGLDAAAFQSLCLPLKGTPGAGCGEALAGGMTTALAVISLLPLVAVVHFLIAARKVRA